MSGRTNARVGFGALPLVAAAALGAALVLGATGCGSSGSSAGDASTGSPPITSDTFIVLDADVTAACTGPQLAGFPQGVCSELGQHCISTNGSCCDCIHADLASCNADQAWVCGDDLQKPCPATPPTPGGACDAGLSNLGCTYCVPPGGSYFCENGAWDRVGDVLHCGAPLVPRDAGKD
jgi:hypothetical protein